MLQGNSKRQPFKQSVTSGGGACTQGNGKFGTVAEKLSFRQSWLMDILLPLEAAVRYARTQMILRVTSLVGEGEASNLLALPGSTELLMFDHPGVRGDLGH